MAEYSSVLLFAFATFVITVFAQSNAIDRITMRVYRLDRFGHPTLFQYSDAQVEILCSYDGPHSADDVSMKLIEMLGDEKSDSTIDEVRFETALKSRISTSELGKFRCSALINSGSVDGDEVYEVGSTMCSDGIDCRCSLGKNRFCVKAAFGVYDAPNCSTPLDEGTCSNWTAQSAIEKKGVCAIDRQGIYKYFDNLCSVLASKNVHARFLTTYTRKEQCSMRRNERTAIEFDFRNATDDRVPTGDHVLWVISTESRLSLPVWLSSTEKPACRLHFEGGWSIYVETNFDGWRSNFTVDAKDLRWQLERNVSAASNRVGKFRCEYQLGMSEINLEAFVFLVLVEDFEVKVTPPKVCVEPFTTARTCSFSENHLKGEGLKTSIEWYFSHYNTSTKAANSATFNPTSFDIFYCAVEFVYTVCSSYGKVLRYKKTRMLDLRDCTPEKLLGKPKPYYWISVGAAILTVATVGTVCFGCYLYYRRRDILSGTIRKPKKEKKQSMTVSVD